MKIQVYAKKASALNLRHPIDGPMKAPGAMWEQDGFTARLLTDGAITREADEAWKAPPAAQPAAAPPTPPGVAAAPEAKK